MDGWKAWMDGILIGWVEDGWNFGWMDGLTSIKKIKYYIHIFTNVTITKIVIQSHYTWF